MAFGVLDLSIVTALLIEKLEKCADKSDLWNENQTTGTAQKLKISFTGLPPDLVRKKSDAVYVSLYLFHVAPEKFHRNTYPVTNYEATKDGHVVKSLALPQQIPQQPLPLTLYYLLSAQSDNYTYEQQAMSVALKCMHEHPILTASVPRDGRKHEFTMTMEPENVDEIGRLWQSTATPLRLSAVYRASVIFLKPRDLVPTTVKQVERFTIEAYPKDMVFEVTLTPPPADLRTIRGGGFVKGAMILSLDDTALELWDQASPPPAGKYVFVNPTKVAFVPPAGTTFGRHRITVWFGPGQAEPAEAWVDVP